MRKILSFLLFLASTSCFAQESWTKLGDSLIHDPKSMAVLAQKTAAKHKVFDALPPGPVIQSLQQGYGRQFKIFDAKFPLDSLKQDLKKGLSPAQLTRKYPQTEWGPDSIFIYRFERTSWEGKTEQVFAEAPYRLKFGMLPQNWVRPELSAAHFVFETYTTGDSGQGFYFYGPLSSRPLPKSAARCIQYVDFMVGEKPRTMFSSRNKELNYDVTQRAATQLQQFLKDEKLEKRQRFDQVLEEIKAKYATNPAFRARVDSLADATLVVGSTHYHNVNPYILPCLPLKKRFEIMCRQPLDWSCGNDALPRFHILETGRLAAELGELQVFLLAHYLIITDSYGSLEGFPKGRTYFRELEAVGMDILPLVVGANLFYPKHPMAFRENLGTALREVAQTEMLENGLLQYISDPALDELNRLSFIWLYRNYARTNRQTQPAKMEKLRSISSTLPPKLREALLD